MPGEHDLIGDGSEYLKRFGKGTNGEGWYSFDHHGVHFVARLGPLAVVDSALQ